MKKEIPHSQWGVVFMVSLVFVNLFHSKAVDAEHAHAAALYRLIVTFVCMIGLATILFLNHNKTASAIDAIEKKPVPPLTDGPSIHVVYQSTKEACWRCERYLMFHVPSNLCILGFMGLPVAYLLANPLYKINPVLSYFAFPFLWFVGCGLMTAFILLGVSALLQQRFPQPDTIRICTTGLTPHGVIDQTPDKRSELLWSNITLVRQHEGDLFFGTFQGTGCYIPRHGFATREESQQFYTAALSLWKNRGANWTQVAEEMSL